ncbi:unnamed protein product [Mytilus coruscus]|uniref:Uncharacterized protein n=1 Tax=Mytilus coruscus TaxID=42192 RepID=A0A6J8CZF7_MYTCO|nr:unnamed protein product [Mytilus coruscus]
MKSKGTSDGEHKLQSIDNKDVENTTNLEETKVAVTDVRITIHNDKIQEETQTKTVNFETAKALTKEEETFWEQLIEKYLKPLEKKMIKQKKEIQHMIEKERNKKGRQRLLDLDQVVREAIPINDVIEGQNNKTEQNNVILRQFGRLTGKEREAMRKFINGKQKNVLKNKLEKELTLNENTTQL